MSAAVAAVRALTEVIKVSKGKAKGRVTTANTLMELEMELKTAADLLRNCNVALSVASGCELFTRFVTRTSLDVPDFVECKRTLIARGGEFTQQAERSRNKIARLAGAFVRDGATILTHGFSRVAVGILRQAAAEGKRFRVIVAEGRPDAIGYLTALELQAAHIPVSLIVDSAVGSFMEQIDFVLLGAEGIVENGGIINKIGTYQISIVASAFKKPLYIAAESFKFMRLYPLSQRDLRDLVDVKTDKSNFQFCSTEDTEELKNIPVLFPPLSQSQIDNPSHDYTPPSYITLLFTELGVLTPSAVSDELIKLYY